MNFPSIHEVDFATHYDICRWYRFLESPINPEEVKVLDRIFERFTEFGGFTPELSRQVGWQE